MSCGSCKSYLRVVWRYTTSFSCGSTMRYDEQYDVGESKEEEGKVLRVLSAGRYHGGS
jgi:hypothetical protein